MSNGENGEEGRMQKGKEELECLGHGGREGGGKKWEGKRDESEK